MLGKAALISKLRKMGCDSAWTTPALRAAVSMARILWPRFRPFTNPCWTTWVLWTTRCCNC
eukprot:1634040-Pyramimonas_sp.AAC.1